MLVLDNLAKLFFLLVALFAVHVSAVPRPDGSTPVKRTLLTNAARRIGTSEAQVLVLSVSHRWWVFFMFFVFLSQWGSSLKRIARTPTTSALPTGGNIKVVRKSNGVTVGYVSKNTGLTGFGVTDTPSDRLSVTFTPISPFNIAITGNKYPFLGFAGGNLGTTDSHSLVATNPTAPGASPQNVGNTVFGTSESSIWSYDSTTRALTAQWINSSGPRPETHFWYYPLFNKIAIVRTPSLQLLGYEVMHSAPLIDF
ncbi:LOW QUALITY PROTEIN: hypothetical protein CVT25_009018 [Psilocybe cyanescens]|uniref:Uncharacterized protein n=1 Tax=Psilocybe cyanescens TaxID=93625 RepID=A0A409VRI0_PSICY|nr:LOW QUALITY PROTEIN: hypothetical protein CVT25_009018 [Psilocybe cyanescens]